MTSFPLHNVNGFLIGARRDKNSHRGGLLKFVYRGFLCIIASVKPNYINNQRK